MYWFTKLDSAQPSNILIRFHVQNNKIILKRLHLNEYFLSILVHSKKLLTESFLAFKNKFSNVFICYSKWTQYKTTNMVFRDKKIPTILFKKMENLNNSMFCKNIFKSFWYMHAHTQSGFNFFSHCFYSLVVTCNIYRYLDIFPIDKSVDLCSVWHIFRNKIFHVKSSL